ncbi:MAG: hypothetical protein K6B64_00460 [Acholeplasmatales bacterium]|nr:hypothetical protein [Acholeplasmatales bacterium]
MAYKPKKVNKQKKEKKEKDPNKFHLGWNTGTYLIILGGIALLVLIIMGICSIVSYVGAYNTNTIKPYSDKEDTKYEGITYYEAKDFNNIDIDFYCVSFDSHDAKLAKFNLTFVINENTGTSFKNINSDLAENPSGNYVLYTQILLTSNLLDYNQESGFTGYYKSYITEETKQTKSLNVQLSDLVFPATVNTWPVPLSVSWPDAYLFVSYWPTSKTSPEKFVIHYTPEEFIVTQKTEDRNITSPVH